MVESKTSAKTVNIVDKKSDEVNDKEPSLIDLINDQKKTGSVLKDRIPYADRHKPIVPPQIFKK